jgi:DNA-directed RNA polymerase specialized sigma24 family protein
MGLAVRQATSDPADVVARVAVARRELLLRAHRQRLRHEDLEDCYSQATLELVVRSRRAPFANTDHVKNALEQKFVSRINDRRRALAGRSGIEAAIANAVSVDGADATASQFEDRLAVVERQVEVHADIRRLREVIAELTVDQRLVLHSQVNLQMDVHEFCELHGWSAEKFRKVAQRARAKLRVLVAEYQDGGRCNRLEPDLLALVAGAQNETQLTLARRHIENCSACAHRVASLSRTARGAAVTVPVPAAAALTTRVKLSWLPAVVRRVFAAARHQAVDSGIGGATGVASGSTGALVIGKAGVVALCIAGAAGGYAVCERIGSVMLAAPKVGLTQTHRHVRPANTTRIVTRPSLTVAALHDAHPLTVVAQVKREFGAHRVRITASSMDVAATSASSPAPVLPGQSASTVRQEATEFGFER